ncbi:TonB-dependent receptor plug domain-containing protein [Aromatoleum toluvorans]|uniref:TonB-dependent receptor plug domain-containing protein n=2 Tax=Aromatoleum toluvorans TaxID=92002 RepID=A0ABX1PT16_9RHOO|nr:TonB-dependent receptor plug domain-containing protein [Aromatoleum toluvorans]
MTFRLSLCAVAAASIAACPSFSAAQSGMEPEFAPEPQASEASYFDSLPVVLTVSRMPRPQNEVPAALTVLDRETIRATGYRSLDRLLRLVPGMMVAKERGSEQWVSYHGPNRDSPQELQILVDGRSVSAAYFGSFGRNSFPLAIEDIERIEVVRGTDAASYGTNAYMGVVNIITRHTAEERGATVSVAGGTGEYSEVSGRVVARSGPLGLRITAQHLRDEGVHDLNDSRDRHRVSLRSDLQMGEHDELTLLAGLTDIERGTGYPDTPFNSHPERDMDTREHFGHLRWRHAVSPDEEFLLSGYYAYERTRNEWAIDNGRLSFPGGPFSIPVNDSFTTRRQNLEFQHNLTPRDGLRLSWGAEWRRDRVHAPFIFFGRSDPTEESRRLFANVEWRAAPQWQWNFGAMAERFQNDRTRLSPRVFLNWLPNETETWRAGYARAWRNPGVFGRHSDVRIIHPVLGLLQHRFVPNEGIDPSRLDAFELGYARRFAALQGSLDVRVFHERIRDQIQREQASNSLPALVPKTILPPSQWTNAQGTVRLEGVETQFDFRPWQDGKLLLRHTLMRARAGDDGTEESTPPYSASVTWLQRMGAWQSALTLLHVGPVRAGTGFSPDFRYTVPDYTTLDASIAREFHLEGGQSVEVRLTGLNLFGRHQELANFPVQQASGSDEPVNRLDPQVMLQVSARF